jgi:pimeloyl-ACP methyl ester carboxylesterase
VFAEWPLQFPGFEVVAVDLQGEVDVAHASHTDYAERVTVAARAAPSPIVLCGWSMGGLVVLQAATRVRPVAVVLLEPSPPAEIQGVVPEPLSEDGVFDPEVVYGRFPVGVEARPESLRARGERKRGISVPRLECPSLVVYGDAFPDERGRRVAELYGSETRAFPGFDHWDLVLRPEVPTAVAKWLAAV